MVLRRAEKKLTGERAVPLLAPIFPVFPFVRVSPAIVTGLVAAAFWTAGCKSRASFTKQASSPQNSAQVSSENYRKVGDYTGVLALPKYNQAPGKENDSCEKMIANTEGERRPDGGVYIAFSNAPQSELIGKRVWLRFKEGSKTANWAKAATFDIKFTDGTRDSMKSGNIHAPELNCVSKASPLETLSIARPLEPTQVLLRGNVEIKPVDSSVANAPDADFIAEVSADPLQIAGSHVALIKITKSPARHWDVPPSDDKDKPSSPKLAADYNLAQVAHYNPKSGAFDGPSEQLRFWMNPFRPNKPELFTLAGIEKAAPNGENLNEEGWYAYGSIQERKFVVSALEPRRLLQVQKNPSKGIVYGARLTKKAVDEDNFKDTKGNKGVSWTKLLHPFELTATNAMGVPLQANANEADASVLAIFGEGARFLTHYIFGGLYGKPFGDAPVPFDFLVTGHSAYGEAQIVKAPFLEATGELKFDIQYRQVYAHNPEGVIGGTIAWHEFQGNLRRGWVWSRPTSDSIVYLPILTKDHQVGDVKFNALDGQLSEDGRQGILGELEKMAARFRAGDGTQRAEVTPFTSCVQDSAKAWYVAIRRLEEGFMKNPSAQSALKSTSSGEVAATKKLIAFAQYIKEDFVFSGSARDAWEENTDKLTPLADDRAIDPSRKSSKWVDFISPQGGKESILSQLRSIKTMIPRHAHDRFLKKALDEGATIWMIRANQIGGKNDKIWPMAPTSLTIHNQ